MYTHKRLRFCVFLLILSLIITQSITVSSQAESAEYYNYLPVGMRSIFEPSGGIIDNSFGDYGQVITSLTTDTGHCQDVVIQGDGKIIMVGSLEVGVDDDAFVLARYNPVGNLDNTFGGDGLVINNLSPQKSDQLNAVTLQDDGRILVAGSTDIYGDYDFYVARYHPDGSLDTSFDGDGWLTTDFGAGDDYAYAMVLQLDGKILVAGAVEESTTFHYQDFALARYLPDGNLDTSFGSNGKVQFSAEGYDIVHAITVQPDGKIVMAGLGWFPTITYAVSYFLLARLTPQGSLDISFGDDGWVSNDFAIGGEGILDVLLQSDGKIVVTGYLNNDSNGDIDIALARYNPDGNLDTSFAGDGLVRTDLFGDDDHGMAVKQLEDGKFLVGGCVDVWSDEVALFALARYMSDGTLDTSFDGDGWLITDFPSYDDHCSAMALQDDGKIVLAGDSAGDFVLVRYQSGGSLDTTFNNTGMAITDLTTDSEGLNASALQPDGKIVVAGYGWDGVSSDQFLLARYTSAGTLDINFAGTGWVTTNLSPYEDRINDVVLLPDGKILVAGNSGTSSDGDYVYAMARYHPNGSLDTSFDEDGWLTTNFNGYSSQAQSIALQTDGKFVVAGWVELSYDNYDFALARYNPDGSPDNSFNGDGKVTSDFAGYLDAGYSVAIQEDGKIVVVGAVSSGWDPWTDFSIALARYNTDGSLDVSFDGDGWVTTDFYTGGGLERGSDLLLQPDGKIVVTGLIYNNSTGYKDSVLIRYHPDGNLDASFGSDGKVVNNFLGFDQFNEAVVLQPDGKILTAGYANIFDAPYNQSRCILARYNKDGSLNTAFREVGWFDVFFGTFNDECHSLNVQPDGRIILTGEADRDFALIRYE